MSKNKEKERFLEKYKLSKGNISMACDAVNISRQTYYNWTKKDDEFAGKVDDILEANLDMAETKLLSAIVEGKTAELIFFLKTKGKHRGYVERQEIESRNDSLFEIEILRGKNKDE